MKWTDSDNLAARDARVIGGPNAGYLIPVAFRGGVYRHPDVTNLTGYIFDPDEWVFRWNGS